MVKLTKRTIDAALSEKFRRILWDDAVKGFGLQVLPSGVKSFIVQYRNGSGRQRRMTIGRYGILTPDEARKAARGVLTAVSKGTDPVEERHSKRAASNVSELLDRYLTDYAKRQNAVSTQLEAKRLVNKHIRPRIGRLKVAAVTSKDVAQIHRAMASTPRQANHVLSIISKVFNLAETWGMRPRHTNPVHDIKRYSENERERFLSADELCELGRTIEEAEKFGLPWVIKAKGSKHLPDDVDKRRSPVNADAIVVIRLLLYTGARLSEVLSLQWQDVDLQAGTIALPGRKGGGRKPHPASAPVQEILAKVKPVEGSSWVFPRVSDINRHISREVVETVWRRIRFHGGFPDVRLHDLRHTVGTFAAQAGGNAFIVRDLLRHKGVSMTGRYVNADVTPIRAMSDAVASRIDAGLNAQSKDVKAGVVSLEEMGRPSKV